MSAAETSPPVNIVIADDHPVVRQGLRTLIDKERDLSVLGEVADGVEAVRAVERFRPHVLVTDLTMPGMSGVAVTREIRQRLPETRVVILSIHSNTQDVQEALDAGATGYVVKSAPASDVVTAIRTVARGERYVSAPCGDTTPHTREVPLDLYEVLTPREREVLALGAEGLTNAEIGGRLGISPRTAEVHRANLMRKLGLKSQTDLVRYALRRGILPPGWAAP